MERLLPDHRRCINGFSALDVADPSVLASLRGHLDVPVPLHARWNDWEYGSEIRALRQLYEKGKKYQWNVTDLDWSIPFSRNDWLTSPRFSVLAAALRRRGASEAIQKSAMFDETAYAISQLLHGEQAALQICGQLTNLAPTTDEKLFAACQAFDEARHTETIARFLADKAQIIYPVNPVNKLILDTILSADGYHRKALGMQTLFEGVAMGVLHNFSVSFTNPLLVDLMTRIKVDESRHAAFGVITMRRMQKVASESDLQDLERWSLSLLEALNANQQIDMLRTLGPTYDLDIDVVLHETLSDPSWADSNAGIFMHNVVPNLLRLGLITERTRADYVALGMLRTTR